MFRILRIARSEIARLRLPTATVMAVGLALIAIWSGVAFELREDYRRDATAAVQDSGNLARGFGENVRRMIEAVDQVMLLLRAAYAANPDPAELARWASGEAFTSADTMQITFVDAAGLVSASNLGPITTRVDLADREHIRVQLDSTEDRLFISRPVLGRVSGKWSVQFSRKLLDRDGRLAGVIVVSVDPAFLSRFYASVEIGHGAIVLVGMDGIVRARAPGGEAFVGKPYDPAAMARIAAGPPVAVLHETAAIAGEARISSYRRLSGYPLAVVVELAAEDVFAAYRHGAEPYVWVACGLTALVLVGGGLLIVQRRRLLRSQAELTATLEHMSQGILMVDPHGRVPVINRRAAELLALPAALARPDVRFEEILAWQVQRDEFGGGPRRDSPILDLALRGGIGPEVYERARPNGIVLEVRTQTLPDGGAVRTYTDITERRQTERALAAARDAAEAATRARTAFLAMMSHEIRTPMNGVIGMTGLLLDSKLPPTERHYVETLREAAENLLRIINDILDFSKLDADRLEFENVPFNLAHTVNGAIALLRVKAEEKGLALTVAVAPDVPVRVIGDPGRLRQVLLNLLSNAIKFTQVGSVSVEARLVAIEGTQARIGFAVRDTGIGIPFDAQPGLFQQFSQVDSSISRRFGGTGLGLAISRGLVEHMGGEITVESAPDAGAVFRFTIRLEIASDRIVAPEMSLSPPIAEAAPTRRLRILLAEDNATNRLVATARLEMMGHRVDSVANGIEAVAAVQAAPYDLVLMDVMMPEMDGLAATRAIRAVGGDMSHLPIVALTANAFREDEDACRAAGMDGFLPKPLSASQLTAVVGQAISRTLRPADI
jgi:signal transduction histidine kinase/ActR/RegA family two-component response regulator